MEDTKKGFELTKKGKIALGILLLIIVIVVMLMVLNKKGIKKIEIEVSMPSESNVIDDPILGTTIELKKGKKIEIEETIFPEKAEKNKTELKSENEEVAVINEKGEVIGKEAGTTNIYVQTKDGKIKSNSIEITVVE